MDNATELESSAIKASDTSNESLLNNSTWTLHTSLLPTVIRVLQCVIFLLILVNNILVLTIFRKIKNKQTQHHFMIGLSFADLLTLLPYSTVIYTSLNGSIWLISELCDMIGIVFMASTSITSWIHSAMCVEKCFSILQPVKHRKFINSKGSLYFTVGSLIFFFSFPFALSITLTHLGVKRIFFSPYVCCLAFDLDVVAMAVWGTLFLFMPMAIQIVTHILILRVARANSRIRKARGLRSNLKVMKAVFLTLGLYYCCWLPLIVGVILDTIPGFKSPVWYEAVRVNTLVANSGMSFFIYASQLRIFRKQLRETFVKWREQCFQVVCNS